MRREEVGIGTWLKCRTMERYISWQAVCRLVRRERERETSWSTRNNAMHFSIYTAIRTFECDPRGAWHLGSIFHNQPIMLPAPGNSRTISNVSRAIAPPTTPINVRLNNRHNDTAMTRHTIRRGNRRLVCQRAMSDTDSSIRWDARWTSLQLLRYSRHNEPDQMHWWALSMKCSGVKSVTIRGWSDDGIGSDSHTGRR